mgnify:CR=1 FL=1
MDTTSRPGSASLSAWHWLAVALVVLTGAIHVYSGLLEGRIPVALAGVGFFGALVLFLLDYRRPLLYLVGIAYTAVQFPLWYVAKAGEFTTLGYVDKTIQAALILVLAWLYWRHRRTNHAGEEPAPA